MNLYLDASALVKRYIREPGSAEVNDGVSEAAYVATVSLSRVEVAAALAKGVRTGAVERETAGEALRAVRTEWSDFAKVEVSEALIGRADTLAWDYRLRGYDAVQLAAALLWQESLGESVTFGAFDLQLWNAALKQELILFPKKLPDLIAKWRERA